MSATKETKELLDQVRELLDKESRAAVEPILRRILQVAKPSTVTQVEYRSDPRDQAKIEALRAKLAAKDEQLEKVQTKLAIARREETQWQQTKSIDEVLKAADKKAKNFMACIIKAMYVDGHPPDERQKKLILFRSVTLANVVLATYLKRLEPCHAVDSKRLQSMIEECSAEALQSLARKLHAEAGIEVDLKLNLGGTKVVANGKPRST